MPQPSTPAPPSVDEIAASLQGYDPKALSVNDVALFLSRLVQPVVEATDVPLPDALGRVLAQDMISPISVPPHNNSAMDGYALDGAQLPADAHPGSPPLLLRVVGTALAGQAWRGAAGVGVGECLKVMTGAMLPPGLDTVVPQEFVHPQGDCIAFPAHLLQRGDNRRLAGEDVMQGQPALQKGERISPAALGLLASLGIPAVPVQRRLRVAYFSTGDEILSLGEPPREGAVYDSNRYTVLGLLARLGVDVIDLGVVRDDPSLLEAAFLRAAAQADAIITSGGVSVGEADHTRAMMKKLGDVAFWTVAMRPGRPLAVGRIPAPPLREELASSPRETSVFSYQKDSSESAPPTPQRSAILFGLPGNPVAVMVTFLAFVRPALLQMMGSTEAAPPLLKARSQEAIRKKPGRTEYQRGTVSTATDGHLLVKTTGNQGSGVLSSMVQANGLIVLHHHQGNVAPGDEVDVMVFDGVV